MAAAENDGAARGSVFQVADPHGVEETLDPSLRGIRVAAVSGCALVLVGGAVTGDSQVCCCASSTSSSCSVRSLIVVGVSRIHTATSMPCGSVPDKNKGGVEGVRAGPADADLGGFRLTQHADRGRRVVAEIPCQWRFPAGGGARG